MIKIKFTPSPWIAKMYPPREDGGRPHWGVRQSPDAPSGSVEDELLSCGFSICEIVEQDMENIENGIEYSNAMLISASPDGLKLAGSVIKFGKDMNALFREPASFDRGQKISRLVCDLESEANKLIAKVEGKLK